MSREVRRVPASAQDHRTSVIAGARWFQCGPGESNVLPPDSRQAAITVAIGTSKASAILRQLSPVARSRRASSRRKSCVGTEMGTPSPRRADARRTGLADQFAFITPTSARLVHLHITVMWLFRWKLRVAVRLARWQVCSPTPEQRLLQASDYPAGRCDC